MIRYLKRNELDVIKYDNCIENAINSRIYVFSWYLDIVADNWDALILDDYEVVMPLPWRSKYFIKYIYPPAWTQQLGVFSEKSISEELILKFIKTIPKKFKKITIQFNSENKFQHKNVKERVNYILPLDKTYKEIYSRYRRDRKKRLRKGKEFNLEIINNSNFQKMKESFKANYKNRIEYSEKDFEKLRCLISEGYKRKAIIFTSILNYEKEPISNLLLLKGSDRIVVLFSSTNAEGLKKHAFTFLIDEIIKKHEMSSRILDFEGSNIKSIASFNKSFGAQVENYFFYQNAHFLF